MKDVLVQKSVSPVALEHSASSSSRRIIPRGMMLTDAPEQGREVTEVHPINDHWEHNYEAVKQ